MPINLHLTPTMPKQPAHYTVGALLIFKPLSVVSSFSSVPDFNDTQDPSW